MLAGRVRHDQTVLAESSGARQHYERLSMVDSLTGQHNRRWFDTMFPLQMARQQQDGRAGALLMVDVDHFKGLNDVHGHAVGDAVLRRLGTALAAGLRPGDLLAHFGGEEFSALVADIDGRALHDVAERLRRQVRRRPRTSRRAPSRLAWPPCSRARASKHRYGGPMRRCSERRPPAAIAFLISDWTP